MMDKKRERDGVFVADSEETDGQPASKTARLSPSRNDIQPTSEPSSQSPQRSTLVVSTNETSGDPSAPEDIEGDPLVLYQRAQLAARIAEQSREVLWLREKVNELQKLVAVLDAAPRAALYHMCAVREDLTLTLARLGLSPETDEASNCPIAATLLDAEIVTNDSLAEMPAALKKLTAQIVLVMEAGARSAAPSNKTEVAAIDELHRRLREVSDQLERYAERDKQSLVSSTTFRDEYDDLRDEASVQRRRIVMLETRLQEERKKSSAVARAEDDRMRDDTISSARGDHSNKRSSDQLGQGVTAQNNALAVNESMKELAETRLQELHEAHNDNKRLLSELEGFRAEIARRDSNVVPIKTVITSALYQSMEATLQHLYLKEKTWQAERDARDEEFLAERKHASECLEQAKAASEKKIEGLHKQLDEMRRIADAAKVEKDKVVMTYEARKMEASNAAAVISAAEKRADVSDVMREKLVMENKTMAEELRSMREHNRNLENQLKKESTSDVKVIIDRLQESVEEERAKSNAFIQEVESLSNMFGEVEAENKRLVKLLAEKETVLSKVLSERLRGRQLLTTIREENRALTHGRDLDAEKIKQLTAAVAASKKMAQEAMAASNKGLEEGRALSSTLEKRRRIADDASMQSRTAAAEKDELKRERDVYQARAEKVLIDVKDEKFEAKRLRERLVEVEARLKEAKNSLDQQTGKNEQSSEEDMLRDRIIQDLRKRLHCSVVTTEEKAVVLLRCGHLFSRKCTDNLIATRNRKCPICGKPFGNDDVRSVFL